MPLVESQLEDSEMGFRKGKGTRDAIFQLRMISERVPQMNRETKIQKGKLRKRKINYSCALQIIKKHVIE